VITFNAAIPSVPATIRAAVGLIEQARRSPTGQMMQLIKAFIGLAAIVVVPVVLIYWARKKYRP